MPIPTPTTPARTSRATLRRFRTRAGALALTAFASSCSYDFEALDPRLGGGGAGAGVPGTCTPGETVPCYGGPDGTEGKGLCHGGSARCNDAGTGYGACEGEVTPIPEDCNTPGDDDCDGVANEPDAQCQCDPGHATGCYDGPAATEGQGKCHAGQQICQPSGTSYGPCYGQMLPGHEDCATSGVDDDCNGVTDDHCASWALHLGGTSSENVHGMALDSTDAVVVVGQLLGTADLGGGNLVGDTQGNAFVAKYDKDGAHQWSKVYGAAGSSQSAIAVAVDRSDGDAVWVAGNFYDTIDFGGGHLLTSQGDVDLFVAKLDSAGNALYAASYGGGAADTAGQRVAAISAANGRVAVAGYFKTALVIDTNAFLNAGDEDGFVAALDSATGAVQWAKSFGATSDDRATRVELDATGNVYLAGWFTSSMTLGTLVLNDPTSGTAAFVGKLDPTGAELWSKAMGDAGNQYALALALHPSGGVVVGGEQDGTLTLSTGSYVTAGGLDMWLLRVDAAGQEVWSKSFGSPLVEHLPALGVDAAGDVLVAGMGNGTIDMGDGPLLVAGQDDWLVARLGPDGTLGDSRRFGDESDQHLYAAAADSHGNWLLAGDCEGSVDFGTGPAGSGSDFDICIVKLPP
jgi:hypothetical protein